MPQPAPRIIADLIERIGRGRLHVLSPTPPTTDLDRFVQEYPTVAARIGIAVEPAPVPGLNPGTVYYERSHDGVGFSPEQWRAWLDRHLAACETPDGDGLLRSCFALEEPYQKIWPQRRLTGPPIETFAARPTRLLRGVTCPHVATVLSIETPPEGRGELRRDQCGATMFGVGETHPIAPQPFEASVIARVARH